MEAFRIFNEELGIKTNRNPYLQNKGTLVSCENVETVRQNIYRKCRGRKAYGSALSSNIKQFLKYKNRLLVHDTNDYLWYDSDGAGTFVKYWDSAPTCIFSNIDNTYLLEGLEAKSNLYINTQKGIYKIDKLDGTFTKAGVPKGYGADIRAEVIAGSWLQDGYLCRYRFVWSITDLNGNKITGAPSDYESFTNGTGGDKDVTLDIYIPEGITVSHQLEVYRTVSLDASTYPSPTDYQLVYQGTPTTTDITNKIITIQDITPDGFRGASLYTNATQQGESEANDSPPYCSTMDLFRGYSFFANTKLYQELQTSLIGNPSATFDIKIMYDDPSSGVVTKTLGSMLELVDTGSGIHLTSTITAVTNGGGLTGYARIQTTANHQLTSGDWVKITGVVGFTALNGRFEVTVIDADEFEIAVPYAATYSSGGTIELYEDIGTTPRFIIYRDITLTDAQILDLTARSIVRAINLSSINTLYEATYTSVDTEPIGKIKIKAKALSAYPFYLQVSANGVLYFSPKIPITTSSPSDKSYISTAITNMNGLMYSKYEEVEHVPTSHIMLVGRSDDKILDIIASKNSLWIIKENDGVFKLTGTSPSDWVLEEYDSTIKCLQRNSIAKGGNNIYMMSNYGYIRLGDAGTDLIGDDNFSHDIKPIFNTDYEYDGYGFFYETEKSYFASTHELTTSTDNDIIKVYNALTNSWSLRRYGVYTNDTNVRCGIVINDVMYTAPLTGGQILIERKDFQTTDYKAPDVSITISSIDTTTGRITLSSAVVLLEESLITQGTNTTRITSRISTLVYEVISVAGLTAGAATVSVGIESKIKYHKIHCGYPETEKTFEKMTVFFDDDETSIKNIILRTNSDHYKTTEDTNIITTGVPWGTIEWGSLWGGVAYTDRFITFVPQNHTTGCYLYVEIIHRRSGENCALAGLSIVFEPIDQQFRK